MMDFRHFRMPGLKCHKMVEIIDFRISRMPDLKCTKMVEIMDFMIFRRSQKPSGPGYIRKHQKRPKIHPTGTSRTTFGPFGSNIDPEEGGGLRPPPSFGSGRRPRPYICFKISSKLALRHIFSQFPSFEGLWGYDFLIIFHDPPGSSILYFFDNFEVSGRGPPNHRFL